jgi:hypothetical protein
MEPTASNSAAAALCAEAAIFAPGAASGNFRLPEFWAEAPANWFAVETGLGQQERDLRNQKRGIQGLWQGWERLERRPQRQWRWGVGLPSFLNTFKPIVFFSLLYDNFSMQYLDFVFFFFFRQLCLCKM